jgi:hypothetical protein
MLKFILNKKKIDMKKWKSRALFVTLVAVLASSTYASDSLGGSWLNGQIDLTLTVVGTNDGIRTRRADQMKWCLMTSFARVNTGMLTIIISY